MNKPMQRWSATDGPIVAETRLVDVDIPFGRMVAFMVKWALASIPAALILCVCFFMASAFVGALIAVLRRSF